MKNISIFFVVLFIFSFSDTFSQYNHIMYDIIWEKAEESEYGRIFKLGDNLYVMVAVGARNKTLAFKEATKQGEFAFAAYLKKDVLKPPRIVKEQFKKSESIYIVLMEMPMPR